MIFRRALFIHLLSAMMLGSGFSAAEDRPILRGDTSQFIYLRPLDVVPPVQFLDDRQEPVDLRRFRGKVVLANLWATWCAPCVREMPALDRLQGEIGSNRIAVVAIALDTAGLAAVVPFFRRHGLTHLAIYLDPSHRTVRTGAPFALHALPVSYLIDDQGRAVGYLKGAADWTSSQAREFLEYFLASTARAGK